MFYLGDGEIDFEEFKAMMGRDGHHCFELLEINLENEN